MNTICFVIFFLGGVFLLYLVATFVENWILKEKPHYINGLMVFGDGSKEWWKNGKLHRTDGPAIEWKDYGKEWHVNGVLHRTDGPAIEFENGSKIWCVNGKLHRTNGPAIEHYDGMKEWWEHGKFIRNEKK